MVQDVADEIAATGNRRWCGGNSYLPQVGWPAMGYNDVLALGNVVGTDVLITVGQLNQPVRLDNADQLAQFIGVDLDLCRVRSQNLSGGWK